MGGGTFGGFRVGGVGCLFGPGPAGMIKRFWGPHYGLCTDSSKSLGFRALRVLGVYSLGGRGRVFVLIKT